MTKRMIDAGGGERYSGLLVRYDGSNAEQPTTQSVEECIPTVTVGTRATNFGRKNQFLSASVTVAEPIPTGVSARRSRPYGCMLILLCALLGGIYVWFGLYEPFRVWYHWHSRVYADVRSLEFKRPPELTRKEWDYVVGWTVNLHCNCGIDSHNFERAEMEAFADELERRLQGPVDMKTIDWIWDEYARLSKYGQKYSDKYRPTDPEQYKEGKLKDVLE